MNFRKMVLAGSTLAVGSAIFAGSTQASILDRPHFEVLPIIIVWAADDTTGAPNMVTDFIIGSGPGVDLIAADGRSLYTGDLTATEDAAGSIALGNFLSVDLDTPPGIAFDTDDLINSTFSSFDVSDNATVAGNFVRNTSFFMATNTPFSIHAQAADVNQSNDDFGLDDISFEMSRTQTGTVGSFSWGSNTAAPDTEVMNTVSSLNDLTSETEFYTSDTRTAGSPGNIVQQSVRFDSTYKLFGDDGYDLSGGHGTIEAEVTYTFYAL